MSTGDLAARAEPLRLKASDPSVVPAALPAFFDSRYVLPPHREKLLQRENAHPRDLRIAFFEDPHVYTVDGVPVDQSGSGLAHRFVDGFDGRKAIGMMRCSSREAWPRLKFVADPLLYEAEDAAPSVSRGVLLYDEKKALTRAVIPPGGERGQTFENTLKLLRSMSVRGAFAAADERLYSFESEMGDDAILKMWSDAGEEARNRGTEAHLQLELWLNSEACRIDDPEVGLGLDFLATRMVPLGARAYRTEWEIFGEEEDVAGSVDVVLRLAEEGQVVIVDWKRSEKLDKKLLGFDRMKPPLDHLEQCSGCEYALQLSVYQYLIEKYYGLQVRGRILVDVHPACPIVTSVPYLAEEVEYIMACQRAKVDARSTLEADANNAHLLCARTSRLLLDAVRTAQGELVCRKVALIEGESFEDEAEVTTEAKNLLERATLAVAFEGAKIGWRDRMPKAGIPAVLDPQN